MLASKALSVRMQVLISGQGLGKPPPCVFSFACFLHRRCAVCLIGFPPSALSLIFTAAVGRQDVLVRVPWLICGMRPFACAILGSMAVATRVETEENMSVSSNTMTLREAADNPKQKNIFNQQCTEHQLKVKPSLSAQMVSEMELSPHHGRHPEFLHCEC